MTTIRLNFDLTHIYVLLDFCSYYYLNDSFLSPQLRHLNCAPPIINFRRDFDSLEGSNKKKIKVSLILRV